MNAARRIGLITPSLAGCTAAGSGIGVHFRHLADGLAAAGHEVVCVVPCASPLSLPAGLLFHVLPAPARPTRLLPLLGKLSWQLHQASMLRARRRAAARAAASCPGVEVWETTSTDAPALDFLRLRDRPPVFTRVSTTARQLRLHNAGRPTWIASRQETWEAAAVRRSEGLLTHSESHRAALAAEFSLDPRRVLLVPHGIPLPPAPAPRPLPDAPRLLFVGRLEHRKGVDLLLPALRLALSRHPRASADLVGADPGGRWRERWLAETPPGPRERVRFPGLVDDAALARHYAAADIFVAPSRYESFGLIFVEAMAHGLPVVALAAPGALDLVTPDVHGLLTPPEDIPALGHALDALLTDLPRARALGLAGRRLAEERYSREALVRASLAAYFSAS